MSNPEYFACGKCSKLLDEDDDKLFCDNCKISFRRVDGSDYPDMDDEDYNDGFPRGVKHD